MQGEKNITTGRWFRRELRFLGVFLAFISFSNLVLSNNTSALFTPTLSVSVDDSRISLNGDWAINHNNGWVTPSVMVTVNTDNSTGYSAYLNTETDDTDLININSTTNARIKSIKEASTYTGFPQNSWGYGVKIYDYTPTRPCYPIPGKSASSKIFSKDKKDMNNDGFRLFTCMMLSDTLESGTYTNKLMLSIVSNPYEKKAKMTYGSNFNTKLHGLETATNKIEHFIRNYNFPSSSVNAINVESYDSDYEIKVWFDASNNTAYYYTNPEKIILDSNCQGMFMRFDKMKELDLRSFDSSLVNSMHTMFYEMRELDSINLSNFDTSNVKNMYAMFDADMSLEKLDVSSFQTDKVTDMKFMFFEMRKLKELDLSNFNTSMVTDMCGMFANAYLLEELDLSNFDTRNVTDMSNMFEKNKNMKKIKISSFDTSKVTDMSLMFSEMSNIVSLDVSNFDTRSVTDMSYMFYGMKALVSLDISNFNTGNVRNMNAMFCADTSDRTDNLEVIYVNNDFDTSKLLYGYSAFNGRNKLRGGNGSYLTNPNTADFTWFRVDRPGVQGYFTRKT